MAILTGIGSTGEAILVRDRDPATSPRMWDLDSPFSSGVTTSSRLGIWPLRRTRCQGDIGDVKGNPSGRLGFETTRERRGQAVDSLILGTLFAVALLGGTALGGGLGSSDVTTSPAAEVSAGASAGQQGAVS